MTDRPGAWDELERPTPRVVVLGGVELRARSRVRLRPRAGGDVLDLALAGRVAVVESIEQELDGTVRLAVVVEDDPGRDLGHRRQPGHRFFFALDEVEPLGDVAAATRILVAGIGNVFLGDDGFGVVLADRLARRPLPAGVDVVDYGIRGMDLAYAMLDDLDAVILLDAAPRGGAPGTVYVIEPEDDGRLAVDTHGMDPAKVLAFVRALGGALPRTLVVACEPLTRMTGDEEEVVAELSDPVRAALDPALAVVEELLEELTQPRREPS